MNKFHRIIDDIFTQNECKNIIKKYESQLINSLERDLYNGVAKYYRTEINDEEIYNTLTQKVKLPKTYNGNKIYGFLPNMRIAKYNKGGYFPIHQDGVFQDNMGRRSILTLNMFLSDEFEGGATTFFYDDKKTIYSIAKPKIGRAALFDREIFHQGNEVTSGSKYLLRTYVVTEI